MLASLRQLGVADESDRVNPNGGGIALGFHMPSALSQKAGTVEKADVNIWVAVGTDDSVVIKYARSEMGQGSMTSAPQLVAEELDADWRKVKIEYADTNRHVRMKRAWGDMATVGSRTIRNSQEYLRKAGASARGPTHCRRPASSTNRAPSSTKPQPCVPAKVTRRAPFQRFMRCSTFCPGQPPGGTFTGEHAALDHRLLAARVLLVEARLLGRLVSRRGDR